MTMPVAGAATGVHVPATGPVANVPRYLQAVYWWAYVHPRAVRVFERRWLVDAILFGHYARLRDAAIDALGPLDGRTLQVACVYGDLTPRLQSRLPDGGRLDVVDVLPIQLDNLREKLPHDDRVALLHADAAALPHADASCDRVLLFFLLHEMPVAVRRATLAEALRVLRPGGRLVVVDYHRPSNWHPLKLPMRGIYHWLEPFAIDLWREELESFMPAGQAVAIERRHWFGGLYQLRVFTR